MKNDFSRENMFITDVRHWNKSLRNLRSDYKNKGKNSEIYMYLNNFKSKYS